jgi:hypothetical protein
MKCVISWAKTMGLPAYSSARASIDLEVSIPEASCSECPDVIVAELRRAFLLAQAEVDHQLATVLPDQHQLERPEQPPASQPDRPARQSGGYDPKRGPDGAARWKTDGFPRSGRELVPWSQKREESGACPGLFRRLVAYGKSQGFPEMVNTWGAEHVNAAVYGVLGSADQYDPEPEPAPAGRNGAYSNGHANGRGAY